MDILAVIAHLVASPEYWAGVGTVIFLSLVCMLVFATFLLDDAQSISARPAAPHRGAHGGLSNATNARRDHAGAANWPRRDADALDILRYDQPSDQS